MGRACAFTSPSHSFVDSVAPTRVLWALVPEKGYGTSTVLRDVLMEIRFTDPPQRPLPHPQPQQPEAAPVRPPMVYAYERQQEEYKAIVQTATSEQAAGWELVGVVPLRETTQFHFKRVRT
jgi:hypothetical protein